jgi:hypothetical protein
MSTAITKDIRTPLAHEMADIMRLIEQFGELLCRETEALKKADFKAVDALQQPKRSMAEKYQSHVTALAARGEEMKALDLTARERFIQARTRFTLILNDNLKALELAKDSTRRLVGRILDTARKSVVDEKQTNYSARGQTQACKTSTLSLSLDQKL